MCFVWALTEHTYWHIHPNSICTNLSLYLVYVILRLNTKYVYILHFNSYWISRVPLPLPKHFINSSSRKKKHCSLHVIPLSVCDPKDLSFCMSVSLSSSSSACSLVYILLRFSTCWIITSTALPIRLSWCSQTQGSIKSSQSKWQDNTGVKLSLVQTFIPPQNGENKC